MAPSSSSMNTNTDCTPQHTLTIGKVESGVAVVLTEEMDMMEIPASLLPPLPHHHLPAHTPPVVRLHIDPAVDLTTNRLSNHLTLQQGLRDKFDVVPRLPSNALQLTHVTHTTALFKWPNWATFLPSGTPPTILPLRAIEAYLQGRRLAAEIAPEETILRLTGLTPDTQYNLQLAFRCGGGGGRLLTEPLTFQTRPLTDFSCLRVTLSDESKNEELMEGLRELGVVLEEGFDAEHTSLVVTRHRRQDEAVEAGNGPLLTACKEANIPLVTAEWVQASKEAGRMLSVSQFYLQ